MALKSTIYKADLQVADMDRHYYASHVLTLARHPSETDERMMVRLLAYARHAHEYLEFCKGISDTDEPDLWQRDLTGHIERWIDVGQPDERRLLKAAGRADEVWVYAYTPERVAEIWWRPLANRLERARNLRVLRVPDAAVATLAAQVQRTMRITVTIQDGQIGFGVDDHEPVQIELATLKDAAPREAGR